VAVLLQQRTLPRSSGEVRVYPSPPRSVLFPCISIRDRIAFL
jgi:hypothetical protein